MFLRFTGCDALDTHVFCEIPQYLVHCHCRVTFQPAMRSVLFVRSLTAVRWCSLRGRQGFRC